MRKLIVSVVLALASLLFVCSCTPSTGGAGGAGGTLYIDKAITSVVAGQSDTITIKAAKSNGAQDTVSASSAKGLVTISGPAASGDAYTLTVTGGSALGDDTITVSSGSGQTATCTVRVTDPLALHCDGLLLRFVNNFTCVTNDHGSSMPKDITIFDPTVPDGYSFLGTYVAQTKDYANGALATNSATWRTIAVKEINDSGALAKPTGFTLVWTSTNWANGDIKVFKPIAPANYYALGFLILRTDQPDPDAATANIRCVRKDFVAEGAIGGSIWDLIVPFVSGSFFSFYDVTINDAVTKQEDELFLNPDCPFAFKPAQPGTSVPAVSDGFLVLKIKCPVMLDQNDETYAPRLTKTTYSKGEVFPVYYRRSVAVPYYLVQDGMVNVPDKLARTPVYRIERDSYFTLGEFLSNLTMSNITDLTLSSSTGITDTSTKTQWESQGIEISGSVGFKFASFNFKISKEMGFASSQSTAVFDTTTVSYTFHVPAGKVGGIFQKNSDIAMERRTVAGDWEDVCSTMTVREDYIVPDEFPHN